MWEYAREQGYTIVSRDADFSELTLLQGFPPKVVWVRRGNCSTREIAGLLRQHHLALEELEADPYTAVLTLF